jgi:hypothetical protein
MPSINIPDIQRALVLQAIGALGAFGSRIFQAIMKISTQVTVDYYLI